MRIKKVPNPKNNNCLQLLFLFRNNSGSCYYETRGNKKRIEKITIKKLPLRRVF